MYVYTFSDTQTCIELNTKNIFYKKVIYKEQWVKNQCGFWGTHDVGFVVHWILSKKISLQILL